MVVFRLFVVVSVAALLAYCPFVHGSVAPLFKEDYVCVEVGHEEMVCTNQVLETRQRVDGKSISTGVSQRIDGSETEKDAIREVLQRMDDYFLRHVLAMPEYEYARDRCKNSNELCAFWSSVGECETNREFMLASCPAACRICLLLNSGLSSTS